MAIPFTRNGKNRIALYIPLPRIRSRLRMEAKNSASASWTTAPAM